MINDFAEVLESPPVRKEFKRYHVFNEQAIIEQDKYKWRSFWLPTPLVGALLLSLILLVMPQDYFANLLGQMTGSSSSIDGLVWGMPVATVAWQGPLFLVYLLLGITPILAMIFRPSEHFIRWQMARGTAESARRQLFEVIMNEVTKPKTYNRPLLAMTLEHFRRWQVELQETYMNTRGREQDRAANRANTLRIGLLVGLGVWIVVALLANASGTTEQGALDWHPLVGWLVPWWHGVAAWLQQIEVYDADRGFFVVSALLGAAAAGATYYVNLDNSVRNAKRYRIQRENFEELLKNIGGIRDVVNDQGQTDIAAIAKVRGYQHDVHSIMALELADWVRLAALDQSSDPDAVLQDALAMPTRT